MVSDWSKERSSLHKKIDTLIKENRHLKEENKSLQLSCSKNEREAENFKRFAE